MKCIRGASSGKVATSVTKKSAKRWMQFSSRCVKQAQATIQKSSWCSWGWKTTTWGSRLSDYKICSTKRRSPRESVGQTPSITQRIRQLKLITTIVHRKCQTRIRYLECTRIRWRVRRLVRTPCGSTWAQYVILTMSIMSVCFICNYAKSVTTWPKSKANYPS